jgi:hypothetical protein
MDINIGQMYLKCKIVNLITARQKTNSQGELYDVHTHFTAYLPSTERNNSFTLTKVKCTDEQLDSLSKNDDINVPIEARTWKNENNYGLSLSLSPNFIKDTDSF